MFEALHQLARDHQHMSQVLDLLERRIGDYASGRPLDADALAAVMDYLLHYPELCHHPKEDLIYRRLAKIDLPSAAAVGDILAEHRALSKQTRAFAAAVRNVALGGEIPREWFEGAGHALIAATREHIVKEENGLFPLALRSLTARDWWEIDGAVLMPDASRLGAGIERDYLALYGRIMELDA